MDTEKQKLARRRREIRATISSVKNLPWYLRDLSEQLELAAQIINGDADPDLMDPDDPNPDPAEMIWSVSDGLTGSANNVTEYLKIEKAAKKTKAKGQAVAAE